MINSPIAARKHSRRSNTDDSWLILARCFSDLNGCQSICIRFSHNLHYVDLSRSWL